MSIQTIQQWVLRIEEAFLASDLYFGHGTDNAYDEAVWLVFHELDIPYDADNDQYDQIVPEEKQKKIWALAERRIQEKKPLAYLLHEAWFAGLKFYVDERVLIPRSPLAEFIEAQAVPWIEPNSVKHILDLCTGSGCIAIACAKYFPWAKVDASDISADALSVAKKNIDAYQLDQQVTLIESDLFSQIPSKKYDLIISNPPYVDAEDMSTLPAEYLHEPSQLALAAGKDGLSIVDRILASAKEYLTPTGVLVIEVGNSAPALENKYPNLPMIWLTFYRGGEGVFLLYSDALRNCSLD